MKPTVSEYDITLAFSLPKGQSLKVGSASSVNVTVTNNSAYPVKNIALPKASIKVKRVPKDESEADTDVTGNFNIYYPAATLVFAAKDAIAPKGTYTLVLLVTPLLGETVQGIIYLNDKVMLSVDTPIFSYDVVGDQGGKIAPDNEKFSIITTA